MQQSFRTKKKRKSCVILSRREIDTTGIFSLPSERDWPSRPIITILKGGCSRPPPASGSRSAEHQTVLRPGLTRKTSPPPGASGARKGNRAPARSFATGKATPLRPSSARSPIPGRWVEQNDARPDDKKGLPNRRITGFPKQDVAIGVTDYCGDPYLF